jgi:hypothetical protein
MDTKKFFRRLLTTLTVVPTFFVATMTFASAGTLLNEDWETGNIEPAAWNLFGSPLPVVVTPGFNSTYSVDVNGDNACDSELRSVEAFPLRGTVLEFDGRVTATGGSGQATDVGFTSGEPASGSCGAQGLKKNLLGVVLSGVSNYNVIYTFGGGGDTLQETIDDQWHHYKVEILHDGHASFYRDGDLKYTSTGIVDFGAHPAREFQDKGRAVHGPILVDNIVVRRVPTFNTRLDLPAGTAPWSVATGDMDGDNHVDLAVANFDSGNVSVLLGNGNGTFQDAVNYGADGGPYSVAVGDLNGDDDLDLVVANGSSNNVSILLGDGDGTFQAAVNYAAGDEPRSVAIGDLNGDTDPDLAVANLSSDDVSVLIGNGNGTFQSAVSYATGDRPYSVAIGDVDGVTGPDLVVACDQQAAQDGVSVLLGNGNGTFQGQVFYAAGADRRPRSVTLGDLDGDTDLDVVLANSFSGTASVLLGNGNGTFQSAVFYGTGRESWSVAVEDLNSDTDFDLVVANYSSGDVSILLGNGNGTFQSAVNYSAGRGLRSVAVDDMNGDSELDVAVVSSDSENVSVLFGNGDGTLQSAVNYGVAFRPGAIAIGGLDSDADLDLAVTSKTTSDGLVLLGNGDGTFESGTSFDGGPTYSMAIGDMDGDDDLDLAVPILSANEVDILLGNGDGSFVAPVSYGAGNRPVWVAIGDVDGDDLDLAVANSTGNDVSILLGNGNGTFQSAVNYGAGLGPQSVVMGDLNGDDELDVVAANYSGNDVSILLGNGNGTFQSAVNYGVGAGPWSVAVGDLDGDNDLDVASANRDDNNVSVLLGNGNGTFQSAVDYEVGNDPRSIVVGDLDGNSSLDIAVARLFDDKISILFGNGDGTFQNAENFGAGGGPDFVTMGDLDGDGRLDLVVSNHVTFNVSVLMNMSPAAVCIDTDGDGYGNPASPICTHPELDCDDTNLDVNPGAIEGPLGDAVCSDTLDNDCDGLIDGSDPGCLDHDEWYVDASAETLGTGLPGDPFRTIQQGIGVADAGDRIQVADGFYEENVVWADKAGIELYSESGDPSSCILEASEAVSPVISGDFSADRSLEIRGMTIRGGSEGISFTFDLPALADEVRILGNTIEGNTNHGIRIDSVVGGSVIVSENTISGNGIGVELNKLDVIFTGNTVNGNTEQGVILGAVSDQREARVNENRIYGNGQSLPDSYGILITAAGAEYYGTVEMMNNEIYANQTEYGAVIEAGYSTVEVASNRIHSHTDAVTEAGLLVMRVAQPGVALLEVVNNTVYANSQAMGIQVADEGSGLAGAFVTNNLVVGNEVGIGVVRGSDSFVEVRNNTVADNLTTGFELTGVNQGVVDLVNMILWANGTDDIFVDDVTNYSLRYSDVADIGGENEGEGVLHQDPLFAGGDRYELDAGSPCEGTGIWQDETLGADMGHTGGEEGYNTFVGQTVSVDLAEEGVTVEFSDVASAGRTWAYSGAGVPGAYTLDGAPRLWDISTDAEHTGPVSICLHYEPSWFSGTPGFDEQKIRMMHRKGVDEDFSLVENIVVDTVANEVCGDSLTGLSVFAVFYPLCIDEDEDGYGYPASEECPYPEEDCDDTNEQVNPGMDESPYDQPICSDGVDNDCDNDIDAADPGCEDPSGGCAANADAAGLDRAQAAPAQGTYPLWLYVLLLAGMGLLVGGHRLSRKQSRGISMNDEAPLKE